MHTHTKEHFLASFANRLDAYYVQVPGEKRYQAVYKQLTLETLESHLSGSLTLSLPAISKDQTSKWLGFDCDNELGHLDKITEFLTSEGWTVVRASRRAGRDGHLFFMLDEPIPSASAVRFGKEILSRLHIPGGPDGVELFPKQTSAINLSNGLRLPLGINSKPGVNQFSFFELCEKDIAKQLAWFMSQTKNSSRSVCDIATDLLENDQQHFQPTGLIRRYFKNKEKRNLLEFIPSTHRRLQGKDWITQCPVCAHEGHDQSRDNLHISTRDGTLFRCWYQGGGSHTARDILTRLGLLA